MQWCVYVLCSLVWSWYMTPEHKRLWTVNIFDVWDKQWSLDCEFFNENEDAHWWTMIYGTRQGQSKKSPKLNNKIHYLLIPSRMTHRRIFLILWPYQPDETVCLCLPKLLWFTVENRSVLWCVWWPLPLLPWQSVFCLPVFQIPGGWGRGSSGPTGTPGPGVYKALAVNNGLSLSLLCRHPFGYVAVLVPLPLLSFTLFTCIPQHSHTISPFMHPLHHWFHWLPLSVCFRTFLMYLINVSLFNKLLCLTFENSASPILSGLSKVLLGLETKMAWLGLGKDCGFKVWRHGYNNNHMVNVREWPWSCFRKTAHSNLEKGNEPKLKTIFWPVHPDLLPKWNLSLYNNATLLPPLLTSWLLLT